MFVFARARVSWSWLIGVAACFHHDRQPCTRLRAILSSHTSLTCALIRFFNAVLGSSMLGRSAWPAAGRGSDKEHNYVLGVRRLEGTFAGRQLGQRVTSVPPLPRLCR